MRKILVIILLSVAFASNSQTITIPVNRISQIANDSTLFNFRPYTVELSVIGGASFGNMNFYYKILDSVAANTQHVTPFGQPFTRTPFIDGNIIFPNSVFNSAFDSNNKPIIPVFNQILGFMDMIVDETRQFILR